MRAPGVERLETRAPILECRHQQLEGWGGAYAAKLVFLVNDMTAGAVLMRDLSTGRYIARRSG